MGLGVTESVIEEIKARIDLAELISSYGISLRRAGASVKACCPFHNEKTPSFNINQDKGFYHCFGCGESGDAFKFVMKMEGLSFPDAAKKLAGMCGVKLEERLDPEAGRSRRLLALMNELSQFYWRCLVQSKAAAHAREYLKGREIGEEIWKDWVIGYAPEGIAPILKWAEKHGYTVDELAAAGVVKPPDPNRPGDRGYHRFSGRLMFSIRDKHGRVVAFSGRQLVEKKNSGKYVNSPETVIFKKSNVLFGFDRASGAIARSPHREVICCEGQIDTIRLHISGFTTAVASQGTAFTDEHARMIKRVADAAVLMYDDDAAGRKATVKVARMLLAMEMPVRVVGLPGGDDPDSYLRSHPAGDLQKLIDDAESIISFQCRVERAKESNPDSIDAVARVSKAVLETVACCQSAVLRAAMIDEASRILGLPTTALQDELVKVKSSSAAKVPRTVEDTASHIGTDEPEDSDIVEEHGDEEPPRQLEPPPPHEMALMELLLANEYDSKLDGMIGDLLPDMVLSHEFTRRFVSTWRVECTSGEDQLGAFAAKLPPEERVWSDKIHARGEMSMSSGLSPVDLMKKSVRALWCDWLARCRGELPVNAGADVEARRMRLTIDIKRISTEQARWNIVKEMINGYMNG